jgi:hypothetical protein
MLPMHSRSWEFVEDWPSETVPKFGRRGSAQTGTSDVVVALLQNLSRSLFIAEGDQRIDTGGSACRHPAGQQPRQQQNDRNAN